MLQRGKIQGAWYLFPSTLKGRRLDKAVKDDPSFLQFVPDWFVTQKQIDVWDDKDKGKPFEWYDYDKDKVFELYDDDDKYNFFEWYDGYKKRKA